MVTSLSVPSISKAIGKVFSKVVNEVAAAERARLDALESYDVLDSPPEAEFDDLTRLAAQICEAPIALITLIDNDRQWFKSRVGLEVINVTETPRDLAFCRYTILGTQPLVVPDAQLDERFANNPLVTGAPHIRFYAGAPLTTSDGHALGSLCIVDSVPRELTARQRETLVSLSRQVVSQLERRRGVAKLRQAQVDIEQARQIHDNLEARIEERAAELRFVNTEFEHVNIKLESANAKLDERITECTLMEDQLQRERDLTAAIIEIAGALIVVLDREGHVQRFNRECERIAGRTSEEVCGRFFWELLLLPPEDVDGARHVFAELRAGNFPNKHENFWMAKDGSRRLISWSNTALVDQAGQVEYVIGIGIDITERKRMERELEEARDMALESARLKSEFLANMSHEIRTPMNGVIGMTSLLLDTRLNIEQREITETVRSSADALLGIINDILDFSKIEAGKRHFERLDFNLNRIIDNSIAMLAERAHAKGLELAAFVDSDVPAFVRGDANRLRQILTNLMSNAVKFTEHGEILLRVEKESETESHVHLRFAVTDTGIGISEEDQRRLFQPFMQTDGSMTRRYGGTGLGLAISKQLAELMGGEIGVDSQPGAGATFWFTARFERHTIGITAALKLPVVDLLKGLRILIVDDNATNRRILMHQLARAGMLPTEAASGQEALAAMRRAATSEDKHALVILDLQMPEMDGFELARRIKNDDLIACVPLVLLASFGWRGQAQLAREAGINAYLTKPIRAEQLFNCLATVIKGHVANGFTSGPVDAAAARAPINADDAPQFITKYMLETETDAESARVLLAEDNPVNQKVARHQLEKLGYQVDAVGNGREAVEAVALTAYDVVLMDCQMPEMDGYEATREIRRREREAAPPLHTVIVAMTANAMEGDREKCLRAGMDDYISKPVKFELLAEILRRWHSSSSSKHAPEKSAVNNNEVFAVAAAAAAPTQDSGEAFSSAAAPSPQTSPLMSRRAVEAPIDASLLNDLQSLHHGYGAALMAELCELYLCDTSLKLSEMREALTSANWEMLLRLGHSLRGSSASFGVRHLARLSERLEHAARKASIDGSSAVLDELEEQFAHARRVLEVAGER